MAGSFFAVKRTALPTSSHLVVIAGGGMSGGARPRGREWVAVAVWVAGMAGAMVLDDPRRRFPAAIAAESVATVAWLWMLVAARGRLGHPLIIAAAIGARIAAISLPPAFSEDVFRHIYEGRAALQMGPGFVFVHPPSEAAAHGVDPALLDASWLRINHSALPTLYPPFSQATFMIAAAIGEVFGHLSALKTLLVLAELGAIWAIARAHSGAWVLPLFSPLAVLEIAREGHADSLSMLGLALGAYGFIALRPRLGYAGFALAALAKLNGIFAIAAALRTTRRGAIAAALMLPLLALPFAFAGLHATTSLGEYAASWRTGDGIFSLILAVSEQLLGGDWRRIGEVTITRHQLARAISGAGFLALSAVILRRRGDVVSHAGLVLLALLLFTPALHPWYVLWLLPFAALAERGRAPMIALAALAPLLHHPGWLELSTGTWSELAWVRALVHVPVWFLLVRDLAKKEVSV